MVKALLRTSITVGLINIPVKIYTGAKEREVHFRELCPECKRPLKHLRYCENCKKIIEGKPLKGFEIAKDQYIVIVEEELEKLKIKGLKEIELIGFIEKEKIDPLLYDRHYYLIPEPQGKKAYELLREALAVNNLIAVAKVTIRNSQRLAILRAYKNVIVLTTLFYPYELVPLDAFEEIKEKPLISDEERSLTKALIETLKLDKIDLSKYKDEYIEKLKELIIAKIEGKEIEVEEEVKEEERSLKEALKATIESLKKKKKKEGEE